MSSPENRIKGKYLVVVKRYPSKDSLYEYAFVHARVKAYIDRGMDVSVFCYDNKLDSSSKYTYEGVEVESGNKSALMDFIENNKLVAIATHLLTEDIWAAISHVSLRIPVYVWVHGSEIQDWTRRHFTYETAKERVASVKRYRKYYDFWRSILGDNSHKLHFIFVSQYFADEIMDDLDIVVDKKKYSIIHNFIDTNLFSYSQKNPDQRKMILSIRPFESTKYANDITVKAIVELSKDKIFKDLKFTIVGDGRLFDEVTAPIKNFANVKLSKRFLSQKDIAKLHKTHGLFVSPTRMDAQGVSRDEAMSSGLVPITSNNTAIPEFVSRKEGFLVGTEDHLSLAESIRTLYKKPNLFTKMSKSSAERVRTQSSYDQTVDKEIKLLSGSLNKVESSVGLGGVFKDTTTEREKILRNATFELLDEYDKVRRENWKKIHSLSEQLNATRASMSYRSGKLLTLPARRLYKNKITGRVRRNIKAVMDADNVPIMHGNSKKYGEIHNTRPKKTFRTYKDSKDMVVAAIMDDFTYTSFKYECNIVQLTPQSWLKQMEESKPDMLFLESAWRGVDALWTNTVARMPDELYGILHYCHENNIPTVFWNKEDPVHTVHFMKTASLCDFVFTTDSDSIPLYQDVLGHDRVYLLPFAAQPAYNNPIEKYDRKDGFNFAGSYYRAYKQRCRDFKEIVDAVISKKDLDIYDRNYGKNLPLKYQFPDEYKHYIRGSLAYDEIDKAYKGYRYAITMNTIKYSSTMFARRGFELLASNTITVGNYSKGIKYFLGELTISDDKKDEIINQLNIVTRSVEDIDKFRLLGLRRVLEQHTYEERWNRIMGTVFSSYETQDSSKKIAVFALVSNQDEVREVIDNYKRQNYKNTRLTLLVDNSSVKVPKVSDVSYDVAEVADNGKTKLDIDNVDYVAVFNPGSHYGRFYITDLVLATKYSDADVIGKSSYYSKKGNNGKLSVKNDDREYTEGVNLRISKSLVSIELLSKKTIETLAKDIKSDKKLSGSTLSIDRFNYCERGDLSAKEAQAVEGYMKIDQGTPIDDIYKMSDEISFNKSAGLKLKLKKHLGIRSTYPEQEEI